MYSLSLHVVQLLLAELCIDYIVLLCAVWSEMYVLHTYVRMYMLSIDMHIFITNAYCSCLAVLFIDYIVLLCAV